ncbi:MAG: DUF4358 domain-containing protein [Ruminococcaceae bacterium]|nr:DUF4358 domain-containing protein [Oscillospiraceae bacterium]
MKKITAFLAVIVSLMLMLNACSSNEGGVVSKTDKTAAELLNTVVNSIDFPQLIDVTDESRIGEMGIDLSIAEDYAVVQQMLSVDVVEVIILKVKDGEVGKAVEALEARRESLINDFAFYPEQVESANATVVGSEREVAYLICHVDAAAAEEKLIEEINVG